ncbi:MAG: prephenate dehydratase [Patescibacteria group bacterium]
MYITKETIKIGFFGEPGSNTEQAARGFFSTKEEYGLFNLEYLPFVAIPDLLEALRKKVIGKAVLPIENSIEGVVTSSIDELINGNGIKIEDELIVRIRHHLIGVGPLTQVIKIISHPQALAQCNRYISSLHLPLKADRIIASFSTSAAVREVAEKNDPKIAAIGSTLAFSIYKGANWRLKIIAGNIQDSEENKTRFFILGHESKMKTGKDKTSIIFGTEDKPGALKRVLDVFELFDINIAQLSSRPSKKKLGEYLFWVDFVGHRDIKRIHEALELIAEKTTALKVLGSYPKAE